MTTVVYTAFCDHPDFANVVIYDCALPEKWARNDAPMPAPAPFFAYSAPTLTERAFETLAPHIPVVFDVPATGSSDLPVVVTPGLFHPPTDVPCCTMHPPVDAPVTPAPVPLPAGGWLLLAGLACVFMLRKRS